MTSKKQLAAMRAASEKAGRLETLEAELKILRGKAQSKENQRVKADLLKYTKAGSRQQKASWTLEELSRALDTPVTDVEEAVEAANREGYDLVITEGEVNRLHEAPRGGRKTHIGRISDGKWLRFGVLGDNQGGNRHERLDVAQTAYEHFKREGIDTVYHTGNLVDGFHPRLNGFELLTEAGSSVESQLAYIGRAWPKVSGITTHFITGECHEGWWAKREGINIGRIMEDRFRRPSDGTPGRDDMIYMGHEEADIELRTPGLKGRGPMMRVTHPGGGTAYAMSYKTQKMAEAMQGGEKPQILLVGHFHKYDCNYAREIWNLQTGCLCDQTMFMRKNIIAAHVGYLIVEVSVNRDGTIQRFRHEWVPFFDKGFYQKYETW